MAEGSGTIACPGTAIIEQNGFEPELARRDRSEIAGQLFPAHNVRAGKRHTAIPRYVAPCEIARQCERRLNLAGPGTMNVVVSPQDAVRIRSHINQTGRLDSFPERERTDPLFLSIFGRGEE